MVATHDFNDRQVDAAIAYVAEAAARDGTRLVTYPRVFAAAGLPPPEELHASGESHLVPRFMMRLHDRCVERALPPLDCLVVHVEGARRGYPGGWYFALNGYEDPFGDGVRPQRAVVGIAFWQGEVRRCRDWGAQSRPPRPPSELAG